MQAFSTFPELTKYYIIVNIIQKETYIESTYISLRKSVESAYDEHIDITYHKLIPQIFVQGGIQLQVFQNRKIIYTMTLIALEL